MRRWTILCTVLAVVCCAAGSWAATGITVKATKGFDTTLQIKVEDVTFTKGEVAGRPVVSINVPNTSVSFDKDAPELPRLTALVMVDPRKNPIFSVVKGQAQIVNLEASVIPSRGNFTRDIDPANVPYAFGDVYAQDKWYPADADLVKMGEPFTFRDVRGVNVVVTPVQYNPVKNQLRVYRNLSVAVSGTGSSRAPVAKGISKIYEPIYRNAFINFRQVASRLPRLEENGRLLVICYDEYLEAINPFVVWKQKCGLTVVVAKASEAGKTADEVKAFIQKEYNKGGLTHIMLVGDAEQIPTLKGVKERADSDPCYTKLAGDDHVPDCIISRLSATNAKEVAYQVAKFVNYEAYPTVNDKAWYRLGTGIASNQGNPTDFARCEELRAALEGWNFTKIDKIYDPNATKAMVAAAVNEGRSLINYIGHGSTTSWGTTYFSNTDCAALTNGWKMPLIWSVACVNGQFVGKTCFCEAWMRAGNIEAPAGAVGIFGSSTNQEWVPPCVVQAEINNNYTINELYKTAGGLAFNGIMKGLEVYGVDPKGSGVMMFEQWHLFGDGTLQVRFKDPVPVTATVETVKADDGIPVRIVVKDAEGKPVNNARVVVYTEGVENASLCLTNSDGEAAVKLPKVRATEGYVTVTGPNLVPVIDQKITF
ncbi:MAG: hypothetical protein GX442_05315 [Candidatus Riflebacteria bacterium]|nr:hypothetical protein [Candidatus Riflebacteria bacterium]